MKRKAALITLIPLLAIGLTASFTFVTHYEEAKAYSPSDPFYTGESKIKVGESYIYQNIALGYVGALEVVWNTHLGAGTTVAIIDSGIDINHPDLQGKILANSAYITRNPSNPMKAVVHAGLEYLTHDFDKDKYVSHGTNTAGVIAAKMNNEGIVGIAPEANILAIKVDMYNVSVHEAIKYATDNGADVINISLGTYAEPYVNGYTGEVHNVKNKDYFENADKEFQPSINYAYEHNVIIVASAGNEKTSVKCYPAANKHVIGVGAFKPYSNKEAAVFSNYNDSSSLPTDDVSVDVCAPGYVVTTDFQGPRDAGVSTYCQTQGTSFSAPIVSAAALLWKEKYPLGTPNQFKSDLIKSCIDVGKSGWDPIYGFGALNIQYLLNGSRPVNRGCFGSLQTTSILLSTISLVGIGLIIIKKRNKKEEL
ncbi:MAG: S8 family serine peptidase [Bacilli bacterium]|nr:S8 family serine peptidase [Bacilli bacterium]